MSSSSLLSAQACSDEKPAFLNNGWSSIDRRAVPMAARYCLYPRLRRRRRLSGRTWWESGTLQAVWNVRSGASFQGQGIGSSQLELSALGSWIPHEAWADSFRSQGRIQWALPIAFATRTASPLIPAVLLFSFVCEHWFNWFWQWVRSSQRHWCFVSCHILHHSMGTRNRIRLLAGSMPDGLAIENGRLKQLARMIFFDFFACTQCHLGFVWAQRRPQRTQSSVKDLSAGILRSWRRFHNHLFSDSGPPLMPQRLPETWSIGWVHFVYIVPKCPRAFWIMIIAWLHLISTIWYFSISSQVHFLWCLLGPFF